MQISLNTQNTFPNFSSRRSGGGMGNPFGILPSSLPTAPPAKTTPAASKTTPRPAAAVALAATTANLQSQFIASTEPTDGKKLGAAFLLLGIKPTKIEDDGSASNMPKVVLPKAHKATVHGMNQAPFILTTANAADGSRFFRKDGSNAVLITFE